MGGTPPTAECGGPEGIRSPHDDEFPLILDSAALGELIGRVADGPWFRIGAGGAINMPNSGDLWVIFNDRPCCYVDNSGAISLSITPMAAATDAGDGSAIAELARTVQRLVQASNFACQALDCGTVAEPVLVLDHAFTISDLTAAIALSVQVRDDLEQANKALDEYGKDSPEFCRAIHTLVGHTRELHESLVSIVPGLELVFPLPAFSDTSC
jgi:hypothetical protein